MSTSASRNHLRLGERVVLMILGLVLAAAGFGTALTAAVSFIGWFIFLAALGVVELAMALWYRRKRS